MATVKKIKKAQLGDRLVSDNTLVKKPVIRDLKREDALEKVKLAKQLYKDNPGKVYRTAVDSAEARLSRVPKQKNGGKVMIKRKDGSKSPRGLWDNIRAAKGSGKKPTAAMLKQEKKIKAKTK